MTRKAISRILFAFVCMFVMVFALGMQEPKTVAHAVVNQTERPTYVQQDIVWTNLPAKYGYAIDSGCRDWVKATDRDRSKQTLSLYVTTNTSTSSRTGYVYATLNGKKLYTLTIVQGGHSHIYGGWTITRNATCTYDGSKYCTCHICGQRWTQSIPHLGHSNTPWKVEQQPTCGAAGVEAYTCTRCGYRETRSYGSPTGKHTYGDWFVSKKPACTAQGIETRKCTGCSATQNRSIDSCGGHVYRQINVTDPNRTTTKFAVRCARCGETKNTIDTGSDIIFCYERFGDTTSAYNDTHIIGPLDWSVSFRKETDSFFEYKKNCGNYGVNTYLLYYSSYNDYRNLWNNLIPYQVRNIYDYGHGCSGSHEFEGDHLMLYNILLGKRQSLDKKKVTGIVYNFCCSAGSGAIKKKDLAAYPLDYSKLPSAFADAKGFCSAWYYAWLCPDAMVISNTAGVDYDDTITYTCNGIKYQLTLPSSADISNKYHGFVIDCYNSKQDKFENRITLTKSIISTTFLDNYL